MRLINVDALIDRFKTYAHRYDDDDEIPYSFIYDGFLYEIEHAPMVDAVPVRHGHWVGIDDDPCEVWECDVCGYIYETDSKLHRYCPNCGARMVTNRKRSVY